MLKTIRQISTVLKSLEIREALRYFITMNIGLSLIIFGIVLVLIGSLIWLGLPLGKLPGDIHVEGERTSFYFPIVTSIVVSIVLTILLNAIFWMRK